MGSTVISLSPSYLEGLAEGRHTLSVPFDGAGMRIVANFTVEKAASQMPGVAGRRAPEAGSAGAGSGGAGAQGGVFSGYTRPASLALTGDADAVLLIPFAVLAVGALGLAAYLLLRRRRG